ncbi:hypothetical protein BC831DRAFT_479349 [Entophlyctis helioformis]|nr:hypothetical protein BC831DRAFT_479349 [Entophlyctis helioformis]
MPRRSRKHYCGYCSKFVPPGIAQRKAHVQGAQHQRCVGAYYAAITSYTPLPVDPPLATPRVRNNPFKGLGLPPNMERYLARVGIDRLPPSLHPPPPQGWDTSPAATGHWP